MSHRKEQVAATLMRAISREIQQLSDPRITGLVSLTRVDVSPDLKRADVFVSVLPEKFESRTLHGLNAAVGHISTRVKKAVVVRSMPRLTFHADATLKKQAKIFGAIRTALDKDEQTAPVREDAATEPDDQESTP